MDFAAVFSGLRREKGYSQRKVANDLNISQALLSHYENGIREPRLDFIVKACEYYGVSADYMLGINRIKDNPYNTGANDTADRTDPGPAMQWERESLQTVLHAMALIMNTAHKIGGEEASRLAEDYMAAAAGSVMLDVAEAAAGENADASDHLAYEAALSLTQMKLRDLLLKLTDAGRVGEEGVSMIHKFSALLKNRTAAALKAR